MLNAKPENVERESEIVAQSGRKGAVTISTNMAGTWAGMGMNECVSVRDRGRGRGVGVESLRLCQPAVHMHTDISTDN